MIFGRSDMVPGTRQPVGNTEEPCSCPEPQPFCSLSIMFTYQGVGLKLRNPNSDIWQLLEKKNPETVGAFFFLLFGMPVQS